MTILFTLRHFLHHSFDFVELILYTYHESYLMKTNSPTTLDYVFHDQAAELSCMCSSCLNAKLNAELLFSDFQELG